MILSSRYSDKSFSRSVRSLTIAPKRVAGADITPRLVERILNDAGPEPDRLPLVQHALMRTWESWAEHPDGSIDLEDYEATGGVGDALDQHADDAYGVLSPGDQRTVECVFRRLTSRVGTGGAERSPTSLDALVGVCQSSEADLRRALRPFTEPGTSFVVIGADGSVDISHETVIQHWGLLSRWATDEANGRNRYQRLLDSARRHKERDAALLRNPELRRMRKWWERQRPNEQWAERYGGDFDVASRFYGRSVFWQRCRQCFWGGLAACVVGLGVWRVYDYSRGQRDDATAAREKLADAEGQIEEVGVGVSALIEDVEVTNVIKNAETVRMRKPSCERSSRSPRALPRTCGPR